MPIQIRSNVFGVHLEELMGYDGEKGGIPRVAKDCAQYLRQTGAFPFISGYTLSDQFLSGLTSEGLFRRSPNSSILRQVKATGLLSCTFERACSRHCHGAITSCSVMFSVSTTFGPL